MFPDLLACLGETWVVDQSDLVPILLPVFVKEIHVSLEGDAQANIVRPVGGAGPAVVGQNFLNLVIPNSAVCRAVSRYGDPDRTRVGLYGLEEARSSSCHSYLIHGQGVES